ncbi:MAG: hypothetical protein RDV48_04840 [Candidatus Eremiobacteraeota bacterium]|nr:hypothetical protein [Candidatus Eremiobacteraeota bacterium]
MSELKEILENFCKIEGVLGAILSDPDGTILDKTIENLDEFAPLEPLLHRSTQIGIEAALKFQKDGLNQSYIEFEDLSITSVILARGHILTIFTSSGVNLGRIRLEIRKSKKAIEGLTN